MLKPIPVTKDGRYDVSEIDFAPIPSGGEWDGALDLDVYDELRGLGRRYPARRRRLVRRCSALGDLSKSLMQKMFGVKKGTKIDKQFTDFYQGSVQPLVNAVANKMLPGIAPALTFKATGVVPGSAAQAAMVAGQQAQPLPSWVLPAAIGGAGLVLVLLLKE